MRYTFPLSLALATALVLAAAGCQKNPDTYVPPSPAEVSPPAPEPVAQPPETPPEAVSSSTSPSSTVEQLPVNPTALAFPGVLADNEVNKKVRIKTTLGDIVIQVEKAQGPNAASNFVYLVKNSFYNGTIFHRVIPGFMIQGGDPTGTGTSGPGYSIPDEPVKGQYTKGTVAMARTSAPNSAGSQFFIMVDSVPLNPATYVIFGHVISGQDVADKIAAVARDGNDRPNADVKMTSVTIE